MRFIGMTIFSFLLVPSRNDRIYLVLTKKMQINDDREEINGFKVPN